MRPLNFDFYFANLIVDIAVWCLPLCFKEDTVLMVAPRPGFSVIGK